MTTAFITHPSCLEHEMGPQNFDFVGYFRFLEKHGYVEFVRGK